MSSVGESSSSGRSAGSAPSHESDSGSDSSSSSSESSSSSPSSSSAASESSSVSSQQAEAARAEESDEPEARSSDAARDAARAGASVSAQQAAAEDAAEKKDAPKDEEAAARAGRAAVASGNVPAATEAAKAGPAARDAVEKEMVAKGQFQAVNDLAGELEAEAPAATAELAPASSYVSMDQAKAAADLQAYANKRDDSAIAVELGARKDVPSDRAKRQADAVEANRITTAPALTLSDFGAPVYDEVINTDIVMNDPNDRTLVGIDHFVSIDGVRGRRLPVSNTFGMNVYDTRSPEGYVAEVVVNVELDRKDAPFRNIIGPPTEIDAAYGQLDRLSVEKAFENFDGLSLGQAPDGRAITLDVSVNIASHQPQKTLTVGIYSDSELTSLRMLDGSPGRARFWPQDNEILLARSNIGNAMGTESGENLTGGPPGQNVVAHEFGHALGLVDEYPGAPGYTPDQTGLMAQGNDLEPRYGNTLGDIARGLIQNR